MAKILQNFDSDLDKIVQLYVTFLIRGDDVIPEKISNQLKISSVDSFSKGDIVIPRKGKSHGQQIKRPWGLWRVSTNTIVSSVHLEDHFKYLLELLEPQKELLAGYLNNTQKYLVSFEIHKKSIGISGQIDIDSIYLGRIFQLCHKVTFRYHSIGKE